MTAAEEVTATEELPDFSRKFTCPWRHYYTDEAKNWLIAQRRAGRSVIELSEISGICSATIAGWFRQSLTPRAKQVNEVARLYRAGKSIEQVADRLDLAASTVRDTLKEAGVTLRAQVSRPREKAPEATVRRAFELRKEGKSYGAIGKELEVSPTSVASWLQSPARAALAAEVFGSSGPPAPVKRGPKKKAAQ